MLKTSAATACVELSAYHLGEGRAQDGSTSSHGLVLAHHLGQCACKRSSEQKALRLVDRIVSGRMHAQGGLIQFESSLKAVAAKRI